MTLAALKQYFRQYFKVVTGGPVSGPNGTTRAAGVLAALDKLAEETVIAPLLTSEVDADKADYAGLAVRPLLAKMVNATGEGSGPLVVIGDPANGNVSHGPLHSSNFVSPNSDANILGFGVKRITLYANVESVKVGDYSSDLTVGSSLGASTLDIVFGYISRDITVGERCQQIEFKNLCRYVEMGEDCARVLVDNCQGSPGAPFVIPPGTTDAVYRNNVLVTASGITPADVLGLIDLAASNVDVVISSTTGKLVLTAHL